MASPTARVLCRSASPSASKIAPKISIAKGSLLPVPAHPLSTAALHKLVNAKYEQLAKPWKASITFPVYPAHGSKDDIPKIMLNPPIEMDICEYFNGGKYLTGNDRLYFCPTMYPPPHKKGGKEEREEKFKALNRDLQKAAKDCGSPIALITSGVNGSDGRVVYRYKCDYCNGKARSNNDKSQEQHRVDSMNNSDKSGRRSGVGKSGSKRVNTTDKSVPCSFHFIVNYDAHGYYITLYRQAGNAEHIGHPQFDPERVPDSIRYMSPEEIESAKHAMDATRNKAVGRNLVKSKYDKYLPYAKLVYIDSLGKDAEDEYGSLFTMLEKAQDVRFNILWSCEADNGDGLVATSSTQIDGVETHCDISDNPALKPVADEAIRDRTTQCISEDDMVFHSIAWAKEKTFRYFKLNPEAVTCDVTSHTNRGGFHLLTFSCKTSINKQVVFLRIWIPNQKTSSFRYVLQESLPKLIPEHIRLRVNFIMKDGDPQQHKEILNAIRSYFKNATDGGCGYHIINMGWSRHVKGADCVPAENLDLWKRIIRGMHKWMYTWMRPGYCETEEEYNISKLLLLQFVGSRYVNRVTGGNQVLIQMIVGFLRNHVFVYENWYLHFRRKDVRNFEVSHSSAHEGTNYGLKSHAAAGRGCESSAAGRDVAIGLGV